MDNWLFDILSGQVFVSDPCHEANSDCQLVLSNVKIGQWIMKMKKDQRTNRVSELECFINGKSILGSALNETLAGKIWVDSGQAGVFDSQYYKNDFIASGIKLLSPDSPIADEKEGAGAVWYSLCCDKTLADEYDGGGTIPFGALASSGWGDGHYDVYIRKTPDEQIVSIRIIFINDADEECPTCGNSIDTTGYCSNCDAYDDDEKCNDCGEFLDYDGICPNHCGEDEE